MVRVLVTCAGNAVGRNMVRALVDTAEVEILATDPSEAALSRLPFEVRKVVLPSRNDTSTSPLLRSSLTNAMSTRDSALLADHVPMSVSKAQITLRVETLRLFCVENGIEVILPGFDAMVIALSQHKAFFAEAGITIPIPEHSVVLRGVDKRNLMECVKAADIPHIPSVFLNSPDDVAKLASLDYPIIAKAAVGHGARSVQIYNEPPSDWKDLRKALQRGGMIAQEYIPGGAGSIHACCFIFDQKHEIKLTFQQKSLKTEFDFGGPAVIGVPVRDERLRSYAERLVREIGPWIGVVMLEFKLHAGDGDYYAMDCNPRMWGLSSMAEDSGMNFPFASVLVAQDKRFRRHESYLMDLRTERDGLVDKSTYSFPGDTHVSRTPTARNGRSERRMISLLMDASDERRVRMALDDPMVHAVIANTSQPGYLGGLTKSERLYCWTPPAHLNESEWPYYLAHLFRADVVRIVDRWSSTDVSWRDLRNAWWFG